jgi:hypothetical protein
VAGVSAQRAIVRHSCNRQTRRIGLPQRKAWKDAIGSMTQDGFMTIEK